MRFFAMVFLVLLFGSIIGIQESFAHTTVKVGPYEIEAGWGIEPPVVGIRNDIVLKITESGEKEGTYTGITSVFKGVDATVFFGGVSKKIDINSDPRPGYYFSPIIPTKTGTYMVELKGELQGTIIDIKIPVEDVEPTAVLDFPPCIDCKKFNLKPIIESIKSLQQENYKIKEIIYSSQNYDKSYDFEIFSLSIASSAIILAVISLVKRR